MVAPPSSSPSVREWLVHQLVIVAIVGSGVAVGAAVRRAWPFYRAMLRDDAPDLAPGDGRARYDVLDGLRGMLCLLVVVHHAAITLRVPAAGGDWSVAIEHTDAELLTGHLAVSFFFAITGFLFYARVVETGRPAPPFRFLAQRAMRVGPALVASGALIFALDRFTTREFSPVAHPREFARLAMTIVSLGAVGSQLIQHNAGVFWTLPYEWAFYLAFPILGAAASAGAGVPVWARLLGVYAIVTFASDGLVHAGPALMFLPGIVAAHAMRVPAVRRIASRPVASAFVLLAAVTMPSVVQREPFGFAAAVEVCVAFTLLCAGCDVFGLLRLPALRAVGVASYSVYLLHGLVLYAARPWLAPLAARPTAAWAATCALAASATGIAFASYRWIEHPGIALGRRWTRGRA